MVIKYNLADRRAYLRMYLEIVDCMSTLSTTDAEKEVLIDFLLLPEEYRPFMFSSMSKNKVLENIESRGEKMSVTNLNNKIYSLLNKKVLIRQIDDSIALRKAVLEGAVRLLKALERGQNYQIVFNFNSDEHKL